LADDPELERRRLAAMLPGADVVHVPASGPSAIVEMVALVTDLDGPIPVLVERGGYEYSVEHGSRVRVLERPPYRLTLTTDRGDFERSFRPGAGPPS
jgi:hypothetical protein